jgi:CDP-2,3-bis-(O-geranylgeranyl)-sn-glycerol synthase
VASARWVFLPVLGAPVVHAPVLRWDLLRGLKRPLDGGRTLRGRRIFGDNKTVRGAVMMSTGIVGAAVALHRVEAYRRRLPPALQEASPLAFGVALAAGTVGGELPNSFIKRRLDVAPGSQHGLVTSVVDQGDLVLGIWVALLPVWRMPARDLLDAFVLVSGIHAAINVAGYLAGARDTFV